MCWQGDTPCTGASAYWNLLTRQLFFSPPATVERLSLPQRARLNASCSWDPRVREANFLIIRVHRCALASAGVLLAHVIHHLVPLVLVEPEHREREDVLA